jgi:hypothetical protein
MGVDGVEMVWKAVVQLPWGGVVWRVLNYWIYKIVAGHSLRRYAAANGIPEGVHVHAGDKVARLIPDLYKKAQEGYDVVFVNRIQRKESLFYLIALF